MQLIIFLHLGLAYWLYRYFVKNDRGSKEPKDALLVAALAGVGAAMVAGIANTVLLPASFQAYLDEAAAPPPMSVIFASSLLIGVIEETLKFLPLSIWLYRKKFFNETTDGIIYFGLSGIWFGAVESIGYAMMYGEGVGLMRLIITPFLHAGFSALAGWGLVRYKLTGRVSIAVACFTLAVVAHGLYDYFLFSGDTVLSIAATFLAIVVNVGVFVLFKRAMRDDEKLGLSAVGTNKYCRNCGASNPEGNLYCTVCGKKA